MPYSFNFDSNNNTEILDVSVIEPFVLINDLIKIKKIVFDSKFNQPIPKLPICIKDVKFNCNFNQDISNIGDHIESIIFEVSDFNYNLATFPKGLKDLTIISNTISSRIENINPGLKSLKIVSDTFNSSIDNLPPGLELLKITCAAFNQPINNLPSGLKSLILENIRLFQHPLNYLPHGLEYFVFSLKNYWNKPYSQTLEHLPNSIKKMVLSNFWGDLNTIGDGVVELDIWFPSNEIEEFLIYIQHWKKIPSSLKILNISCVNTSLYNKHDVVDIIKTNINCNGICINGIDM